MTEVRANRASILTRYRTRIAAQQRTKLTQTEQTALVDAFIADLARLDTPDTIEARCREELALLEEGYPTQTVASRLLAPYRKAIRAAIDAGTLPLNDATSHIVRYTLRATGEQRETLEHWALTHLKYDRQTYQELRGQTIAHNNERQQDSATDTPTHPPTRRPTLAVADLERLQALTDQLGIDGGTAQRFHALLDWAQKDHQPLATPQIAQEQPTATAPPPATSELPLQAAEQSQQDEPAVLSPQAAKQFQQDEPTAPTAPPPSTSETLPIISNQAKTLAWLTDEISSLRAQLASTQQGSQDSRAWRDERSRLQARIDSLTQENGILRKRLDRFEGLRQALWGSGEATVAQDALEAVQATSVAPGRAQERVLADDAVPSRMTQRTTAPGRGQERANRIWQTIQAWNDDPNRPTHEKVALSTSVLEKRFGLFRPTAKAWLQVHQQEVEQHNQAHGITDRVHNRSVPDEVWESLIEQARAN